MTEGKNRIFKRSPDEDPLLVVYQKPEASNHINNSLPWTLAREVVWSNVYTVWHTVVHHSSCGEIFFSFLQFLPLFSFIGEVAKAEGRYSGMERWVGLGDMLWNSLRINKKVFFYKEPQNRNSLSSLNPGFALRILEQKQPNYAKESLYIKRKKEMKAMWAKGPKVFCIN